MHVLLQIASTTVNGKCSAQLDLNSTLNLSQFYLQVSYLWTRADYKLQCPGTMSGKNRRFVADETNWLNSRNDRLKFETSGELLNLLEENIHIIPDMNGSKTGRCQHVTSWI